MPGRLQGKIAVVTGASSGLGRAISLAYHKEGAKVVCADLQENSHYQENPEETSISTHDQINKDGGKAIFHKVDVTDPKQVEALVQKAVEWGGRIDIMNNNAGIAPEGREPIPVWDTKLETWDSTIKVNLTGVFYGVKYASKQMISQTPHSSGDRGWIINTASIYGLVADRNIPCYAATKGAVVNLTRAAAMDCASHRIHVNCICPGYTESAMTEPLFSQPEVKKALLERHPFAERLGEPEDLARACVFLSSEDARWVSGVALPVDGGYTAR